jgi:ABC-2 type transport system permease protein
MSWGRIYAVFLRYFYFFAKLDHVYDLFYWPALDIILWGLTILWIQGVESQIPHMALAVLSGLVFWQIIWRGNYEVTVNMLQEFWNRNLVNLFSGPLKVSEWIAALMLVGMIKIVITIAFGAFLVWAFYTLNIFTLGWVIFPFFISLTLSGWFMGFLSASVMIYYGQRLQMLAWMTAYLFAPVSAVYYPVTVLPPWAQKIAFALPTTYIFEGMRAILYENRFSSYYLYMSFALNIVYIVISIAFFKYMFEKSRNKGLARLE